MSTELATQRVVTSLGFFGIAPFLIALIWPDQDIGEKAFQIYSLAILCFMAGSWWATSLIVGRLVTEKLVLLLLSNTFVLLSIGVVLFEVTGAFVVLGVFYGVLLFGESRFATFSRQPIYYRRMRTVVTSIVMILHFLAALHW